MHLALDQLLATLYGSSNLRLVIGSPRPPSVPWRDTDLKLLALNEEAKSCPLQLDTSQLDSNGLKKLWDLRNTRCFVCVHICVFVICFNFVLSKHCTNLASIGLTLSRSCQLTRTTRDKGRCGQNKIGISGSSSAATIQYRFASRGRVSDKQETFGAF